MKRPWLYVVFGLVFYLFFLVNQLPASWFAWAVNNMSHGIVRIDPIDGNMWNGTGKLIVYYPPNAPHDLGITQWRINPFWLLAGRLQSNWQNKSPDVPFNVTIRLGPGKIELIDTEAVFQARSVGTVYPLAILIAPLGDIKLHIGKISVINDGIEGDANVLWQAAGSSLTPVQPLGDYRLEIAGSGKSAALKLSTLRGALELAGRGEWNLRDGQVMLNGTAMPRERNNEMEPLLKLLGNDAGNGKRQFMIKIRLQMAGT